MTNEPKRSSAFMQSDADSIVAGALFKAGEYRDPVEFLQLVASELASQIKEVREGTPPRRALFAERKS